jgi:hypothetical protein
MFDYAPVGGVTALAGLCFVALLGWRLGLPLEILIVTVSLPTIVLFWGI